MKKNSNIWDKIELKLLAIKALYGFLLIIKLCSGIIKSIMVHFDEA